MAELPARKVAKTLTGKLGCEHSTGDHHYYTLEVDGKTWAFTKISHGAREISDNLIAAMARQLGVAPNTFKGAVACTVSKDAFLRESLTNLK